MREFKRAEVQYQGALNQRKVFLKSKATKTGEPDGIVFSETEVCRCEGKLTVTFQKFAQQFNSFRKLLC